MTQEEKELLLKELCSRAIYGVHCATYRFDGTLRYKDDVVRYVEGENVVTEKGNVGECFMFYQVKPYLRSLKSMTEDEYIEYRSVIFPLPLKNGFEEIWKKQEWLNKHYFDYRGLIKKGLALEAPEGMYKI